MKSSLRAFLASLALLSINVIAQDEEEDDGVLGTIEGTTYIAPSGLYRVDVPVLPELGGWVEDTTTVATFRDSFGAHYVIACLEMEPLMKVELQTRGRKDFLAWFYASQVQREFKQVVPETSSESARYLNTVQDGTLLVMTLLPGGSVVNNRIYVPEGQPMPVAKRGSLLFLRGDRLYMITTELTERVLDRRNYNKTPEQEDAILRQRLLDVLRRMTFTDNHTPAKP